MDALRCLTDSLRLVRVSIANDLLSSLLPFSSSESKTFHTCVFGHVDSKTHVHQEGGRGWSLVLEQLRAIQSETTAYLSVDTLVAVGGLHGQNHSGRRVFLQHQRVGERLEDGSVVVDVLLTRVSCFTIH